MTTTTVTNDLPLDRVQPNPKNLRHRLGDTAELTRSVQAVGIIEPLLVSPNDDGTYTVVAGHRRHAAPKPQRWQPCRASFGRSANWKPSNSH